MIRERISSDPSRGRPKGDPIDDRFCSKVEPDNLPLGEEEREADSERSAENAEVIVAGGEVVTVEFGRVGLVICGDWVRSGSFVLGGTIGAPREKDGGGLTGVALSGDVMDSVGDVVTLKIGSSGVCATASTRRSYLIGSIRRKLWSSAR
jgi:hypothetical protein